MGKGDNRLTPKVRQRRNQKRKKAALRAKIDAAQKTPRKTRKKEES